MNSCRQPLKFDEVMSIIFKVNLPVSKMTSVYLYFKSSVFSCRKLLHCNFVGQYVHIIDQARGQDGWILAEFSLCVFMDRHEVEVHKNAKRERGQYPAILTEPAWSIKDLLYGIKSTEKIIFVLVYFRALKKEASYMPK